MEEFRENGKKKYEGKTNIIDFLPNWLTRQQASNYLQIGISTLDACTYIRKYKIGKSVRYLRKDLDEYLFSHCVESAKNEEEK